jgi:hypothetical protein
MRQEDFPPLVPNPIRVPRREAVETDPIIFDTRTQAWKIYFPDTPEASDPDRISEDWPIQKAAASCSLIELYDRLEVCFRYYQMEFRVDDNYPTFIRMPYQLVEPKPGWKLRNLISNKEYEVKAVGRTNTRKGTVFDGRVYLKGSVGPERGDSLEWLDPEGIVDGQTKLIKLQPADVMGAVLDERTGAGDMAGSKNKPFTPIVTYELLLQQPGTIGNRPFAPEKETKPRMRESVPDPMDPRQMVEIWGWHMDTILDFRCVSMSPEMSDRMTVWVRNFFKLYTSLLKLLGVPEILYQQTKSVNTDGRPVRNLYIRSLQYYFRLEELTIKRRTRIQTFNTVVNMFKPDEEVLVTGETSEIDLDRWESTHDTSGDYIYGEVSIESG